MANIANIIINIIIVVIMNIIITSISFFLIFCYLLYSPFANISILRFRLIAHVLPLIFILSVFFYCLFPLLFSLIIFLCAFFPLWSYLTLLLFQFLIKHFKFYSAILVLFCSAFPLFVFSFSYISFTQTFQFFLFFFPYSFIYSNLFLFFSLS